MHSKNFSIGRSLSFQIENWWYLHCDNVYLHHFGQWKIRTQQRRGFTIGISYLSTFCIDCPNGRNTDIAHVTMDFAYNEHLTLTVILGNRHILPKHRKYVRTTNWWLYESKRRWVVFHKGWPKKWGSVVYVWYMGRLLQWTVQAQLICIYDNIGAVTLVTVHCLETVFKIVQL